MLQVRLSEKVPLQVRHNKSEREKWHAKGRVAGWRGNGLACGWSLGDHTGMGRNCCPSHCHQHSRNQSFPACLVWWPGVTHYPPMCFSSWFSSRSLSDQSAVQQFLPSPLHLPSSNSCSSFLLLMRVPELSPLPASLILGPTSFVPRTYFSLTCAAFLPLAKFSSLFCPL